MFFELFPILLLTSWSIYLNNLTFTTIIFSTLVKHAKVAPIFEKGDRFILTNCRPISELHSIFKIKKKLFQSMMIYLQNLLSQRHTCYLFF